MKEKKQIRKCLNCGKDIKPRPYVKYEKLKFCSGKCRRHFRVESYEVYSKFKKNACEICGATKTKADDWFNARLVVHHIDNDPSNNNPNNLQTLCKKCHSIAHKKENINQFLVHV